MLKNVSTMQQTFPNSSWVLQCSLRNGLDCVQNSVKKDIGDNYDNDNEGFLIRFKIVRICVHCFFKLVASFIVHDNFRSPLTDAPSSKKWCQEIFKSLIIGYLVAPLGNHNGGVSRIGRMVLKFKIETLKVKMTFFRR